MQWSMFAGKGVPALYVFRKLEVALDQKSIAQGERPSEHGSVPRELSCMACTLYHAACVSVKVRMCVIT